MNAPVPLTLLSPAFTPTEQKVISLILSGHKDRQIAQLLSVQPGTVRKHRENILRKANVRKACQLIALVAEPRADHNSRSWSKSRADPARTRNYPAPAARP